MVRHYDSVPDNYILMGDTTTSLPAATQSSPDLVQIDRMMKSFGGKIALMGVSFSVPSGQICGLQGPNGAGKTTLFRLLMGALKRT
jgi:ABC-type sugar transport system ATPase subunit